MKEKNIVSFMMTAGGMVFLQAVNFLIAILLARYLSAGDFGKFQLLFTMVTTLAIIAKLGMDEGFIFFIAKLKKYNESTKLLISYILFFVTVMSIIIGLLVGSNHALINKYLISQFDFEYELKIIILYLPAFVLFTTMASLMRGLEKFNVRALLTYYLAPSLFLLLLWVYILYANSLKLTLVYDFRIYTFLILAFIGIVYIFWCLRKDEKKSLSITTIKKYHKLSFALIFITLIQYMAEQPVIDLLLLSHFMTADEVGIYAVNYRLAIVPLMIYLAFNVIYATKLSKLHTAHEYDKLHSLFKVLQKRMLYLTLLLFVILFVGYDYIILLFGQEYSSGKNVFITLLVGFSFVSMNGLNATMLIINEKKKYEFYLNLFFVLILIFGGYFIVMQFGMIGLAILNSFLLFIIVIIRIYSLKSMKVLI
ncbi:hypothetical protein YH65_07095 [Sulfurovum lithotrophicum]|uniref:Polysaccharide biosynthesis protein C-terminal domain-containing protein n=1 Tax=Sulfurovum lithotrophicum TaxID=206403 RepID=A0A7U4RQS2_9BACT|nr:oligosaccharide flippase family protein [Sulfurovum lithotrophicum]AKF25183.1 hypothetical protein YH65_07095 [Sulfurovum lithotrophicum]